MLDNNFANWNAMVKKEFLKCKAWLFSLTENHSQPSRKFQQTRLVSYTKENRSKRMLKILPFCGRKFIAVLVTQSCPTLYDPMDCSPPGSSIHGIIPKRTLEWVAIPFSRGSSRPRVGTRVSWIAGRFFTNWAAEEALDNKEINQS